MKRSFIGLLAIVLLFFVGCKKEIEPQKSQSQLENFVFDPVIIDKEQSQTNLAKIKTFKDRLNSYTKEVIYYNEEEAQWLIDACANYDFATISQAYPEYEMDTFMYLIPTTPEGISSEWLEQVYVEISEEMESILNTLYNGEEVEIQGIMVDLNTSAGIQNMVAANLIVTLGCDFNETPFSIANNDYWYWGKGLGKVGGTWIGDDASTAITFRANQAIINCLNPGNYTFSNSEYAVLEWDNFSLWSNNGGRIWFAEMCNIIPNGEPFLNPTEMNSYLNNALYLAQYVRPTTATGFPKMIRNIWVEWGEEGPWYIDNSPPLFNKFHRIMVLYGVPNI